MGERYRGDIMTEQTEGRITPEYIRIVSGLLVFGLLIAADMVVTNVILQYLGTMRGLVANLKMFGPSVGIVIAVVIGMINHIRTLRILSWCNWLIFVSMLSTYISLLIVKG